MLFTSERLKSNTRAHLPTRSCCFLREPQLSHRFHDLVHNSAELQYLISLDLYRLNDLSSLPALNGSGTASPSSPRELLDALDDYMDGWYHFAWKSRISVKLDKFIANYLQQVQDNFVCGQELVEPYGIRAPFSTIMTLPSSLRGVTSVSTIHRHLLPSNTHPQSRAVFFGESIDIAQDLLVSVSKVTAGLSCSLDIASTGLTAYFCQ